MMATTGTAPAPVPQQGSPTGWTAVVQTLGPGFASRAAGYDANDSFVAENYAELKAHKVFSAGVPAELGGGGASHTELCALLREMGRYCGSTALAVSMHTHLVGTLAWMWRQGRPVAPLLERIAANQLVLVTTGASDWLDSSGKAERVQGGYRVSGRKIFGSGSPMGDLLLTSAPYDDPGEGPTVLHFAVPMKSEGLTVLDNWRTMGMRATGSNDIVLEDVFVPDAAVELRRPQGVWHPFFNVVAAVALPLVLSVYLGVAEAARELALRQVAKKRDDPEVWPLVGEMDNALATGRMAVREMIELCADYTFAPEVATANAVFIRKTIAAESLRLTVEKALETVGGGGLFRSMGLERLLRDIHGVQFHPLQAKRQHRFTGRVALGLEPVT
jgi:alkylation response protein AidB-like acyl-CoA dehydrogenase